MSLPSPGTKGAARYNRALENHAETTLPWKPNRSTSSPTRLAASTRARPSCGGIFDFEAKQRRLAEVTRLAEDPAVWSDNKRAQDLGRERKTLESLVGTFGRLESGLRDAKELFEIAKSERDDATLVAVEGDARSLESTVADMEFRRMFSNPMDPNNCFLDIQAGSGGTEAQDWASILQRMYTRYCERKGFHVEILEESPGEVAGIKSCSLKVAGDYAYGHLRTETGVHRLVRKSPFDANSRRHTSFASVFVYPEVDETIEITLNPAELRIDTFRASGAGGQHVNKTNSAIRITHIPTNTVVQCQNDRSQHRNKAEAMAMLKSKLYEIELRKQLDEKQAIEDNKTDIGWGHQIRSYVLDQSRIKDLRTNVEIGNTQSVLDGNLDDFIEASLKKGS